MCATTVGDQDSLQSPCGYFQPQLGQGVPQALVTGTSAPHLTQGIGTCIEGVAGVGVEPTKARVQSPATNADIVSLQ